jgi:pimeloyl-ACP methyl ester carboxylesterase
MRRNTKGTWSRAWSDLAEISEWSCGSRSIYLVTYSVMPSVQLACGPIEYEDTGGNGPVLVFTHDFLTDATLWRHVVADLRADYRCVLPTLPLGAHRTPMHLDADLSLEAMGRMIGEFIEAAGLVDVTLIQNAWGGAQVLIAVGDTSRIARMVITSCEAFDNYPPKLVKPAAVLAHLPGFIWLFAGLHRFKAMQRAPGAWGWMSKRPVPDEVMRGWFRPVTTDSAIRRDLRKYTTSVPRRSVLLDWAQRSAYFDRPVLIVWATEDRMMPLEHGRRLATLFPHAQLVEIEDSYTFLPEDQPEKLTSAVRAFLEARR